MRQQQGSADVACVLMCGSSVSRVRWRELHSWLIGIEPNAKKAS